MTARAAEDATDLLASAVWPVAKEHTRMQPLHAHKQWKQDEDNGHVSAERQIKEF